VKDVISGLFILIEDQSGVGDVVELGDTTGTVEEVNLRVTRLRAVDGHVWFVPNGEIRKVGNASLGWNRAVVDVPLPITGGLASTIERVREEVTALCAEERWRDVVDGDPEVWGIETLTADTATVRISVRTRPQQQAALARAMRERLAGLVLRPKY
jgi:small conductance mechanosensitive channel